MSHVAIVEVEIKDLDCLVEACKTLGLLFNEDKHTYKWYGTHVGDYPLPKGFSKNDLGKCDHAISVPNNSGAYEVGVCKRRDGKDGYQLLWDFWQGGYGLKDKVGNGCEKLIHEYGKEVARKHVNALANQGGWTTSEDYNEETGETVITLRQY